MGFWDEVAHHVGTAHLERFWMTHPAVRLRINRRVSGDPHLWPIQWLAHRLGDRAPFAASLSIGCGTGNLERDLVEKGITRHIVGIDVAEAPLAHARQLAHEAGLDGAIEYLRADAWSFLAEIAGGTEGAEVTKHGGFDSVFFHHSLHHFERPADLLGFVRRALAPGGVLYLDEYVGPSMADWSPRRLLLPNLAYLALPRELRHERTVPAPSNPGDPTESIASAEIVEGVERHFRVLERRDYGGNLLLLVYPELVRPDEAPDGPTPEAFDRAVERLLDQEELLLRLPGARSFHTVVLAEPLPT